MQPIRFWANAASAKAGSNTYVTVRSVRSVSVFRVSSVQRLPFLTKTAEEDEQGLVTLSQLTGTATLSLGSHLAASLLGT